MGADELNFAARKIDAAAREAVKLTADGSGGVAGAHARQRLSALNMDLSRVEQPPLATTTREINTALADARAAGDVLAPIVKPLEEARDLFAKESVGFTTGA